MQPRICVVIPVFNHRLTILKVARSCARLLPVIVVDDGSTDGTWKMLGSLSGIDCIRLPSNMGKGAALRAGFATAAELGFSHAITIDADGQHSASSLPDLIKLCRSHPEALISGIRNLKAARAPLTRRLTNWLSNLCFRFETGSWLADTQCGMRLYPLRSLGELRLASERYAFELEALTKAAWAGIPVFGHPIDVDYTAPTSRLSHFRPIRDLTTVSFLHARLAFTALFRKLRGVAMLGDQSWRELDRLQIPCSSRRQELT